MKLSFNTQTILGTALIASLWILSASFFSGSLQGPVISSKDRHTEVAKAKPKETVETVPMDESSGELARHIYKDALGGVQKVVIDFRNNGGSGTIEAGIFGKPCRVTDKRADGSSVVVHLDPMTSQLQRYESKRADGTLEFELLPADADAIRTFYAADGKTAVCRQKFNQAGDLWVEFFFEDGKTVRARYQTVKETEEEKKKNAEAAEAAYVNPEEQNLDAEKPEEEPVPHLVAIIECFDKSGKKIREERISDLVEKNNNTGSFSPHNGHRNAGGHGFPGFFGYGRRTQGQQILVKEFTPEGVLRFEQEWLSFSHGDDLLVGATEYGADGKTKTRVITSIDQKVGDKTAELQIDTYEAGKIVNSKQLDERYNLLKETDAKGTESKPTTPTPVKLPFMEDPNHKVLEEKYLEVKMPSTRMQRILGGQQ